MTRPTSSRKTTSFWKADFIPQPTPSSRRTWRTPFTILMSFCLAAQRAVWLRPPYSLTIRFDDATDIVEKDNIFLEGRFHSSANAKFAPDMANSLYHINELLFGGPTGSLAEAAIGSEREFFRGSEFEAAADALGDVLGGFDIIAFDVNDADSNVMAFGDFTDDFNFGELAAVHFDVDFVEGKIEESGKHGTIMAETHGPGFVVTETEVGREATFADHGRNGAIEDFDETFWIFAMGVTAHGRLIDGNFPATGGYKIGQFLRDYGDERFGERIAIRVKIIGQQSPAESVRPRNAGLKSRMARGANRT